MFGSIRNYTTSRETYWYSIYVNARISESETVRKDDGEFEGKVVL